VPTRLGAAGTLKLAESAFEEGTDLSELTQSRLAGFGVPVGGGRV